MNISTLDKQSAQIHVLGDEASHLLAGLEAMRSELGELAEELISLLRSTGSLEAMRSELGELAEELISLLRSTGIEPTPAPDHIRTEYAGPE